MERAVCVCVDVAWGSLSKIREGCIAVYVRVVF